MLAVVPKTSSVLHAAFVSVSKAAMPAGEGMLLLAESSPPINQVIPCDTVKIL